MNLIKGLMGGIIAGVIGAVIWAAIAYYANVEIGYLAWGIGALVGFAVAAASSGGGAAAGVIAVLITVLSICGGKYVGSYWTVDKMFAEFNDVGTEWTDNNYIAAVANDVLTEEQEAGKYLDFEFADDAEAEDAYPESVWTEANNRWSDMDATAQDEFRTHRQQEVAAGLASVRGAFAWESFTASFGPVDIVFFLLGVVTAWKLGFNDPIGE